MISNLPRRSAWKQDKRKRPTATYQQSPLIKDLIKEGARCEAEGQSCQCKTPEKGLPERPPGGPLFSLMGWKLRSSCHIAPHLSRSNTQVEADWGLSNLS